MLIAFFNNVKLHHLYGMERRFHVLTHSGSLQPNVQICRYEHLLFVGTQIFLCYKF